MSWIELKDAERFLRYAAEHGGASFPADRESGGNGSFFVDCADSPSALVPDVREYHMGCIDDYMFGMKELWKDSGFAELDLLVRIVAAAALRNLHIYQREMYGGKRIAPTPEQLAEIAKMSPEFENSDADSVLPIHSDEHALSPETKQFKPELNPVFYEF